MAEVAIPVIALGAMWLISKDDSKRKGKQEGFDNVSGPNQRKLIPGGVETGEPFRPPTNFPNQTYSNLTKNTKYYPAPGHIFHVPGEPNKETQGR